MLRGTGSSLPRDAVNDDFCDCDDGSDEPGTGACAGSGATLFYCRAAQETERREERDWVWAGLGMFFGNIRCVMICSGL